MKVINRDITADALGGWRLAAALHAGGGLAAQRTMVNRIHDLASAEARALAATGVGAH